jgi:hypothetical protein
VLLLTFLGTLSHISSFRCQGISRGCLCMLTEFCSTGSTRGCLISSVGWNFSFPAHPWLGAGDIRCV